MTLDNLWEYKVLVIEPKGDADEMTRQLNRLGGDGWELVSSFDTNMYEGMTRNIVFVFKRHVRSRD